MIKNIRILTILLLIISFGFTNLKPMEIETEEKKIQQENGHVHDRTPKKASIEKQTKKSKQSGGQEEDEKKAGLKNPGVNCYMNATLQCFAVLDPMLRFLANHKELYKPSATALRFINLTTRMDSPGQVTVLNPTNYNFQTVLKKCFGVINQQQDPAEFITQFIDGFLLADSSLRAFRIQEKVQELQRFKSDLENLLFLKTNKLKTCPNPECPAYNAAIPAENNDTKLMLETPIPQQKMPLEVLLRKEFSPEILTEGNETTCGFCQNRVKATFQNFITHAPEMLTIQLKRFKATFSPSLGYRLEKLKTPISFPLANLDIKDYLTDDLKVQLAENPLKYELVGFIVHIGQGCAGGHYYAYTKHNGHWIKADDNIITPDQDQDVRDISRSGICQGYDYHNPYILFYKKQIAEIPEEGVTTTATTAPETTTTVTAAVAQGTKESQTIVPSFSNIITSFWWDYGLDLNNIKEYCLEDFKEIINFLQKQGLDINATKDTETILSLTTSKGTLNQIKFLIEGKNAQVNNTFLRKARTKEIKDYLELFLPQPTQTEQNKRNCIIM